MQRCHNNVQRSLKPPYSRDSPSVRCFNHRYLGHIDYVKNCFQVDNFYSLLNLLSSYIKRLLSDGFNTAVIGNSPTKSHTCVTLKRCHAH